MTDKETSVELEIPNSQQPATAAETEVDSSECSQPRSESPVVISGDSRPVRNRKPSQLGKQNRIATLSVHLTKAVNQSFNQLELLYDGFDRLETVDAVSAKLDEIEEAAHEANDLYDEWFLLCDNKPDHSISSLFEQYMQEVKMVAGMLEERRVALNEAERQAAEEEAQLASMEASIESMKSELDEQLRIFQSRRETREQQRLQVQQKLRHQQTSTPSPAPRHFNPRPSATPSRTMDAIRATPFRSTTALPALETADSSASSASSDKSLQAIEHFANTLASSLKSTNRSTLDPGIFTGDPVEFEDWELDFDAYIQSEGLTGREPLRHLKRFVGGEAKESVNGYFKVNTAAAYEQARQHLRERFGRKHSVARSMRNQLDEWPKMKPRDAKSLQKFADFLKQVSQSISSIPDLYILNDRQENEKMARKLPDVLQFKWAKKVRDARKTEDRYPRFEEFAEFIEDEADLLAEPILEREGKVEPNTKSKPRSGDVRVYSTSALRSEQSCLFCQKNHRTSNCFALEGRPYEERAAFVRERRLCWSCLSEGHRTASCNNKMSCRTCKKQHPSSLHKKPQDWENQKPNNSVSSKKEPSAPSTAQSEKKPPSTESKQETTIHAHTTKQLKSLTEKYSMVVPVYISTAETGSKLLVYALLDTQSDSCFISSEVASMLQPEHVTENVSISTLTSVSTESVRKYLSVHLTGYSNNAHATIDAYERLEIPCDKHQIPTDRNTHHLKHLQEIQHKLPPPLDAPIGLLIGTDCPQALAPLAAVTGNDGEPFAVETLFGWTVCGGKLSQTSGYAEKVKVCRASTSIVENICTDDIACATLENKDMISQDDLKFVETLEAGTVQTDEGFYQMPLPFKSRPALPDNYRQAERRLLGLVKKFGNDQELKSEYTKFMDEVIDMNQAESVQEPDHGEEGEVWYIPHFAVRHPKKNKLRVVFDCKADFHGTSLNDHLLQGPDEMNSLLGILCRFRRENVAMCCDIQKMFYNFYVNEEDRDYLRFLWVDADDKIVKYRMKVHLFGATSSPGVATYGLRRIASDNREMSEEAAKFIERDFYVDDGITSVSTVEKAVNLIQSARAICGKGNLRLHKITSNSMEVLKAIPESERSVQNVDLVGANLPNLRTLGLEWSTSTDSFMFTNQIKERPNTRRGVLSVISQLYDPLGFIAPFTLVGKNILQEINKSGLQWDDEIGRESKAAWSAWMEQLRALEDVKIPRCVKPPGFGEVQRAELHHFSDASEKGIGACSYLRLVNTEGQTHVTLMLGKARVVPSKGVVTIPRLELMAAVQAVQLSLTLRKELDMDIHEEFFYTDSKIVMGYIANEAKRFQVFVANRVRQIRTHTNIEQWYHVPGPQNPADIASRGLECTKLMTSIWFTGPPFLQQKDIASIKTGLKTAQLDYSDPEVKQLKTLQTTVGSQPRPIAKRFEKFDSWQRLRRAVANLQQMDKKGWRKQPLELEHLRKAEQVIIRQVQEAHFTPEIHALRRKEPVNRSSTIAKLSPYLDVEGILRVGGRLTQSSVLSDAEKHPVLLPYKEHVSRLLIRHFHHKTHHQGQTITSSAVRSAGFWIIGLSRMVKSFIHHCIPCQKMRGRPLEQKMADLPAERLEPSPPFTHIGIDCFGPFVVKDRRTESKRWGLLLVCLYSRAIHIELLEDMSTDAFLNALRSFICIRGPVQTIRCDQGTNFVGASNELGKQLETLPAGSDAERFFREHQIKFKFNPPHASHMGGIWERQIRTIRSVLNGMSGAVKGRLDTPGLRGAFYEAMATVNSRPLAPESVNNPTELILTPNHLITMKAQQPLPPGQFDAADKYSRKMWRRVQGFAEEFWAAWRTGYLSNITKRQRWTEEKQNLKEGDLVLVSDTNQPRNEWSTAVVEEVFPGTDGMVRRAKVRLGNRLIDRFGKQIEAATVLERPVQKLILLLPSAAPKK